MSVNSINASKGRRYTFAEKQAIIDFVEKHNAEHGRGGQSAASKKFKLSPLSISSWMRAGTHAGSNVAAGGFSSAPIAKKLSKLQELHDSIGRTEKEIAKLRAQFHAIKASI